MSALTLGQTNPYKRIPWGKQKPPLGFGLREDSHWSKNGLVGCWLLNEAAGTKYNNLASILPCVPDGTAWVATPYGSALSLNGTTDRIDCGRIKTMAGMPFSVVFNVLFNNAAHSMVLFEVHSTSADTAVGIQIYRDTSRNIIVNRISSGTSMTYSVNTTISDATWYQLAITHNGDLANAGAVKIYANTRLGATLASTNGTPTEVEQAGTWSLMGRIYNDTVNVDGKLLNAFAFNHVISADEVAALYAEPYLSVEGYNLGRRFFVPSGVTFTGTIIGENLLIGKSSRLIGNTGVIAA